MVINVVREGVGLLSIESATCQIRRSGISVYSGFDAVDK